VVCWSSGKNIEERELVIGELLVAPELTQPNFEKFKQKRKGKSLVYFWFTFVFEG
jgi:hypothetical protein